MKPLREQSYLILLALAPEPLYGYGIIAAVHELSDERIRLGAGTLYGALDRLATDGLLATDHEEVVDGRFRRYYRLTGAGRRVLITETQRLAQLARRATGRLGIPPFATTRAGR
ncbi:PadR family transcriptional regulator [Streptomyces sp. SID3343]|uniref:PadR family transcriptional regulator n=1 Tax=Streptomyces sp. SID3343 TaxID=2690260 RepID=UPI00136E1DEB|nr:PadR family transcriptional regulator [Streptomyces sp. SID3343]MYV96974.1 PadR family transcriptional regulator [Streptomyces sp. SID3343]MYW06746.1 PadR family transcriptional regulator [Streptomyces sp. SID3343]